MRGLLLGGLGGVMREENLGGVRLGVFGAALGVADEGWEMVVLSAFVFL